MTTAEWLDHAAKCRLVAQTIEDQTARHVLLEAAEDYEAIARREEAVTKLDIPAYQAAAATKAASTLSR